MNKLTVKSKKVLFNVSNLEKKHKIITYASLLFLTVSTYFLRSENQQVKIDYARLQEKSKSLKRNMIIFNRNYEDFPLPVWQKVKRGDKFIIQYINPEYVKKFGHIFNNDQYALIGKNNFEIFSKKIAQAYYENDVAVAITGIQIENIEDAIDKFGNIIKLKVIKWRDIKDNKDTLIYGMVKEIIPTKTKRS
ncbi:hypothetical protein BW723_09275 [Polaribacter reichenbachii]|uniref:Uncharacterized protein n=1 Tax=Polaribacter reichenbachii TaxID=996801 RepID=A0A1B8U7G3_9FLAO|nr:hypothetical protein [Polaribacter reichenbachii]APZ46475.1 hypothetical protein BW723_09275 [Polaribacter reichenbachii]AUC20340.1 hypothetical protein BTO17_17310 [Polaribacter reichenbachii]OBY67758.1 hypothetical protein LPB301_00225 [Polaribacter reichenbachii]